LFRVLNSSKFRRAAANHAHDGMESPGAHDAPQSAESMEKIHSIMEVAKDAFDEFSEVQALEEEVRRKRKEIEEKRASCWNKVKRVRPYYDQALQVCNSVHSEKEAEVQELLRNGGVTILMEKKTSLELEINEINKRLCDTNNELNAVKMKLAIVEECKEFSLMREKLESIRRMDAQGLMAADADGGGEAGAAQQQQAQPAAKSRSGGGGRDRDRSSDKKRSKKTQELAAGGAAGAEI
jgi:hypothetical protein